MTTTGVITEVKRFATHDGPGIRTTVFFKGCPLRCRWCSNPETIAPHPQLYYIARRCTGCGTCAGVCPTHAVGQSPGGAVDRRLCRRCMRCVDACPEAALQRVGCERSVADVVTEVAKDRPFYGADGGVTLSGGEPLYQPQFCLSLLAACREAGLNTVLDTAGLAAPDDLDRILEYTSLVLFDVKHLVPEAHVDGTGAGNERILANAKRIAAQVRLRISFPLISRYNDTLAHLEALARLARELGAEAVDVNPMHRLGEAKYAYLGLESPYGPYPALTRAQIEQAVSVIGAARIPVTIGRMM